jgi:UDP-N-acetylglucosamine--N-acetylmuramyl-(pentapeptide) pyrophosphoryl-undecaprenol N-acetylglucosamine transferase
MRLLIAVGGGGHFSPALAVIAQLPKDCEILLVGRKYAFEADKTVSLEYQTAKRLNLPFEPLVTGRFQRKFTKHTLPSLIKMPVGLVQATKIIQQFQPDVVLSFGGYVAVPVVLAAAFQRIPIVIHEQTLHAGLANKIAARFAKTICISWRESKQYFPKEKTVLTGNPLRKEFLEGQRSNHSEGNKAKTLPTIYITGGSAGAHGINILIEGCLETLLQKYHIIHQTGDAKEYGDFDRLEELQAKLAPELRERYTLRKFILPEEVMSIFSQADLVISRSGVNTMTELLYLGKPSLLIPLPYGQKNEQLENALFMKRLGLSEIIDQMKTTPEELVQKIHEMVSTIGAYTQHKKAAQERIFPDATEKVIKEVYESITTKDKRVSS